MCINSPWECLARTSSIMSKVHWKSWSDLCRMGLEKAELFVSLSFSTIGVVLRLTYISISLLLSFPTSIISIAVPWPTVDIRVRSGYDRRGNIRTKVLDTCIELATLQQYASYHMAGAARIALGAVLFTCFFHKAVDGFHSVHVARPYGMSIKASSIQPDIA
jgi:hypothetical protein